MCPCVFKFESGPINRPSFRSDVVAESEEKTAKRRKEEKRRKIENGGQ